MRDMEMELKCVSRNSIRSITHNSSLAKVAVCGEDKEQESDNDSISGFRPKQRLNKLGA